MCIKNKEQNGNEIRIKLFNSENPNILEKEVNDWLSRSYFKILKIQFLSEKYLYILYRFA